MLGLGSYYLLAPFFAGGDKKKALAYLEKAVKADLYFADAYVRLAQAWREKGDKVRHDFYLGKALELDPQNELAPGDPARIAARIIESVDVEPAPLRMLLGSQALQSTVATLRKRIAGFEAQTALAASTDFPPDAK